LIFEVLAPVTIVHSVCVFNFSLRVQLQFDGLLRCVHEHSLLTFSHTSSLSSTSAMGGRLLVGPVTRVSSWRREESCRDCLTGGSWKGDFWYVLLPQGRPHSRKLVHRTSNTTQSIRYMDVSLRAENQALPDVEITICRTHSEKEDQMSISNKSCRVCLAQVRDFLLCQPRTALFRHRTVPRHL
jgi:hypothetical protein